MKLSELKANEKAIIKRFTKISETNLQRINSMGINIGSFIYVDPDIIQLSYNMCFVCDDIEFCLRRSDCDHIIVEKVYE